MLLAYRTIIGRLHDAIVAAIVDAIVGATGRTSVYTKQPVGAIIGTIHGATGRADRSRR